MLTTLKRALILATLPAATSAGANQPLLETELVSPPNNWVMNQYRYWEGQIDRKHCMAKFDGSNERFVQILPLNDQFSLLQIACDLGAYQDSHLNYLINRQGTIVRDVTFAAPIVETPEQIKPSPNLSGSFSVVNEQELELVHISAGTGACGFRAVYKIDQVIKELIIEPSAVYGDTDCYNGITVPHWPQVHLQK